MSLLFESIIGQKWAILPEIGVEYYAHAVNLFRDGIKSDYKKNEISAISYINPGSGVSGESEPGSVAVIQVRGPILHRGGAMSDLCGIATYQSIRSQTAAANADENVIGIIYDMDTPGGTVSGLEQCAAEIRAISKQTAAFCDGGMIASAGLYLAAACDKIYLSDKSAQIGSCGTVVYHTDKSGFYEMKGLKITALTNMESPNKVVAPDHQPLSDGDKEKVGAKLNKYYELFRDAVTSGREGVDVSVLDGRMLMGEEAINAGLADSIQSLNQTILQMSDNTKTEGMNLVQRGLAMLNIGAKDTPKEPEGPTVEELAARVASAETEASTATSGLNDALEMLKEMKAENDSLKVELAHFKGQDPQAEGEMKDPNPNKLFTATKVKENWEHPVFASMAQDAINRRSN